MLLNRSIGSSLRSKDRPSDFNFLMQSMEREKENFNFNLTESTTTLDYVEKTSKREPRKVVSVMMDESSHLPRSSFGAGQGLFDVQQLLKKLESYMAITEQLLEMERSAGMSLRGQLNRIADELVAQVEAYRRDNPPQTSPFFNNVSLRKSLNMRGFQSTSKREQSNYLKRIKDLQGDNDKLKELVSRHEHANVKMFVKRNEQESSEIQQYKAQLEASYKAYKELEAKVRQYQQRVKLLERETQNLLGESQNKQKVIAYLQQKLESRAKDLSDAEDIKSLQQTIDQQSKQINTLYSNMKQIVGKYQQKQLAFNDQLERLTRKLRSQQRQPKKVSQSTQVSKSRPNLDPELFACMLIQAQTVQEFLLK